MRQKAIRFIRLANERKKMEWVCWMEMNVKEVRRTQIRPFFCTPIYYSFWFETWEMKNVEYENSVHWLTLLVSMDITAKGDF